MSIFRGVVLALTLMLAFPNGSRAAPEPGEGEEGEIQLHHSALTQLTLRPSLNPVAESCFAGRISIPTPFNPKTVKNAMQACLQEKFPTLDGGTLLASLGSSLPADTQVSKNVRLKVDQERSVTFQFGFQLSDVEQAQKEGKVFDNLSPQGLPPGKYTYVITAEGEVSYGRVEDGVEFGVKHLNLAKGRSVLLPGEIAVHTDGSVEYNLKSGTFTPLVLAKLEQRLETIEKNEFTPSRQSRLTALNHCAEKAFISLGVNKNHLILKANKSVFEFPPSSLDAVIEKYCKNPAFLKLNSALCISYKKLTDSEKQLLQTEIEKNLKQWQGEANKQTVVKKLANPLVLVRVFKNGLIQIIQGADRLWTVEDQKKGTLSLVYVNGKWATRMIAHFQETQKDRESQLLEILSQYKDAERKKLESEMEELKWYIGELSDRPDEVISTPVVDQMYQKLISRGGQDPHLTWIPLRNETGNLVLVAEPGTGVGPSVSVEGSTDTAQEEKIK